MRKHLALWALASLLAACDGSTPPASDAGSDAGPRDGGPDAPPVPIDADVAPGDWQAWDPAAPGPYFAGYRSIPVTYEPPGLSEPRTILVHLWYPTLVPSGRRPRYNGFYTDELAIEDAPLAPSPYEDGHYPVHVYSHGDRGYGASSAFLHRRFASHGWVVVAPDHTWNTLFDNVQPRPIALYYLRALDLSAALDAMEALPAEDPLAGLLGLGQVVASGHSYGTHTMWSIAGATFAVDGADGFGATCTADGTCTAAELDAFRAGTRDPRVVAAIPMAGAISRTWFGPTGHTSVTIPMLAMSGTADPVGADTQWTSTDGVDLTWIDIADACHQFFALGCSGDADLDEDLIVGGFALAFARSHVLGDTSSTVTDILDGTRALSPRVALHRR